MSIQRQQLKVRAVSYTHLLGPYCGKCNTVCSSRLYIGIYIYIYIFFFLRWNFIEDRIHCRLYFRKQDFVFISCTQTTHHLVSQHVNFTQENSRVRLQREYVHPYNPNIRTYFLFWVIGIRLYSKITKLYWRSNCKYRGRSNRTLLNNIFPSSSPIVH